jgi:ATP-dependent DNA ligase
MLIFRRLSPSCWGSRQWSWHPEQNPERARREGIVSKRLGSTYRSGRSTHWVKVQNPAAPLLAPNQP